MTTTLPSLEPEPEGGGWSFCNIVAGGALEGHGVGRYRQQTCGDGSTLTLRFVTYINK
jgi:hypothetical protein